MDIKNTAGINFPSKSKAETNGVDAADGSKTKSSQGVGQDKAIDKAASGFEALLLHEMLKSMWQTVEVKGWLGEDSNEAQIYRDMMNQAIADTASSGKGIGIKEIVAKEMEKTQATKVSAAELRASSADVTYGSLLSSIIGDKGNEDQ